MLIGFALTSAAVVEAQTSATVQSRSTAALGQVLTGPDGKTVYFFKNDTQGVSNCSGNCLSNWPALTVPAGTVPTAAAGLTLNLGTIVRADTGATQVTLNGLPLYYWAADQAPGDTTGHGVNNVWFAVATNGEPIAIASPTTTATAPAPPATGTGSAIADDGTSPRMLPLLAAATTALAALTLGMARRRGTSGACDSSRDQDQRCR